jgi:hypothetical protein
LKKAFTEDRNERVIMSGEESEVNSKETFRSSYLMVLSHSLPETAELNFKDLSQDSRHTNRNSNTRSLK